MILRLGKLIYNLRNGNIINIKIYQMELSENKILEQIYDVNDVNSLFDLICIMEKRVEHDSSVFFIDSKNKEMIKNEYTVTHINKIFKNKYFIESLGKILNAYNQKKFPDCVMAESTVINLFINFSFYFIAMFSEKFTCVNLDFFSKVFWSNIKTLEKRFDYMFDKVIIINIFEEIIFKAQYQFYRKFFCEIDQEKFYNNFKKTRIIVGNYLADISAFVLLRNSFAKIVKYKQTDSSAAIYKKTLGQLHDKVLIKYNFFVNSFKIFEDHPLFDELKNFKYYFDKTESKKIIFLIEKIIHNLKNEIKGDFQDINERMIKKIEDSDGIMQEIENYFINNFCVFKETTAMGKEWSHKSFFNTIKFISSLKVLKYSTNEQWKKDVFLKNFCEWIMDIDENINYFFENDDFDKIAKFIKNGESDEVEFKSTLGFSINKTEGLTDQKNKRKEILEGISKTILALANSKGGKIFVGVVEKYNLVAEESQKSIFNKEGVYFLDINWSLRKEGSTLDEKKLSIQDILKNLTLERIDFLDSLFEFNIFKIFDKETGQMAEILEIDVRKAIKNVYIKKDGGKWISLPKRLSGRVELVDPSKEINDQEK